MILASSSGRKTRDIALSSEADNEEALALGEPSQFFCAIFVFDKMGNVWAGAVDTRLLISADKTLFICWFSLRNATRGL